MDIRELDGGDERRTAVPILRQLWSWKEPEEVLAWTGEDDYSLFGGYVDGDSDEADDEQLVGVAGVLEAGLLHHASHAWLYDLVVDESHRGEGYGRELVAHVEDWARDRDCEYVALASPLEKEDTHEFYEALDYERWGYVIERDLS
jgi:GNAT superfamily N-acetyltransferase